MPRRITRFIAAVAFSLAALTGITTPAMAAGAQSADSVEQQASVGDARTKEERVVLIRMKEERISTLRTKEE